MTFADADTGWEVAAHLRNSVLRVGDDVGAATEAVISIGRDALVTFTMGARSWEDLEALAEVEVEGDREAARDFVRAFDLARPDLYFHLPTQRKA